MMVIAQNLQPGPAAGTVERVMSSTFSKLNLKHQMQIVALNAPGSFEPELAELRRAASGGPSTLKR
jgi:hypothetical protein